MYLDIKRRGALMWDPAQYLQFADERSRPFFELAGRIQAAEPGLVVDLGCGPGKLTATLAGRWPGAEVIGIDSSPEMIEAARQLPAPSGQLSFLLADVRDWRPERAPDVIISNAVLQWVPEPAGGDPQLLQGAGPRRLARLPGARKFRPAHPCDPA